jgi:hypothetical protein
LPHALEALVEHTVATAPATASLVSQVGTYLQGRADLPGARAQFERALRLLEAAYGPDHPNARLVASNLASLDDPQE